MSVIAFAGRRGAAEQWRDYLKGELQLAPTTVRKYRECLYEFAGFAGFLGPDPQPWARPPKAIARRFAEFLNHPNARTGQPLAPATRAHIIKVCGGRQGFYPWAAGPGRLIKVNPLAGFRPPRQRRAVAARAIPWEDRGPHRGGMARLLSAVEVNPRLEVMVWLAYRGGLRVSEIAGLRREEVWIGDRPVMRVHGKGDQERDVDLGGELRDVLAGWLALLPGVAGPLLPDTHPGCEDQHVDGKNITHHLGRLLHRLEVTTTDGKQARPHDLRHTCLTELAEVAADNPLAVQEFAGHAYFSTTQVYIVAANRKTAEAVGKFPKRRRVTSR